MGLIGRFHEIPEFLFISTRHSRQSSQVKPVRLKAPRLSLDQPSRHLARPGMVGPEQDRQHHLPGVANVPRVLLKHRAAPAYSGQRLRCYLLVAAVAGQARRGAWEKMC